MTAINAALKGLYYVPPGSTVGAASLTITVDDQGNPGGPMPTVTKTVNLNIIARPPVIAPPANYQMTRNQTLTVAPAAGLLATIHSPDLAPLTVRLVGTVPAGLKVAANGSFTFTPPLNFLGDVTFQFEVFDGIYLSAPITVKITVTTGGRGRG